MGRGQRVRHARCYAAWLGALTRQPALLRVRIDAAGSATAALVVTETGVRAPDRPESSYRNILAAGFEERYARPNLESPAK